MRGEGVRMRARRGRLVAVLVVAAPFLLAGCRKTQNTLEPRRRTGDAARWLGGTLRGQLCGTSGGVDLDLTRLSGSCLRHCNGEKSMAQVRRDPLAVDELR